MSVQTKKKSTPDRRLRLWQVTKKLVVSNIVTIFFVVTCWLGFKVSGLTLPFYLNDIINRLSRNLFLILALIIPVLAGMGLNFAIVLGAMAGQLAIIAVTHWGIGGFLGFLLCVALATPVAILLGFLIGALLNKTKGQEMITSLIVGFFANGIYQFILLILVGTLIPMNNPLMVLSRGYGIKNTVDLTNGLKYSLDGPLNGSLRWSLPKTAAIAGFVAAFLLCIRVVYYIYKESSNSNRRVTLDLLSNKKIKYLLVWTVVLATIGVWGAVTCYSGSDINNVKLPMGTAFFITALCLFNVFIMRTKLGQDFRAVGMDKQIANVAGIAVDRTRIIAMIISMVLASWGQIIFLQNMGNLNTYGSHGQVGMFAIAAILIGGATVTRATVGQALAGAFLFHTLFLVSPLAGRNLFGDAQMGEFFRAFVAYGVIALALVMHAWRKQVLGNASSEGHSTLVAPVDAGMGAMVEEGDTASSSGKW